MDKREQEIEQALVRLVKQHGGLCLKWVCPGWSGVPDRIVLLPGGRVTFAELKRNGGRLSNMQKWWGRKLQALGFRYFVIWNEDDITDFAVLLGLRKTGGDGNGV